MGKIRKETVRVYTMGRKHALSKRQYSNRNQTSMKEQAGVKQAGNMVQNDMEIQVASKSKEQARQKQ